MTPKDRNIVAARLAGFRVAIVQPGERDIDATHTPLDGEYPCVVDDRGILLFYPDAESTLAPTCYWRPDADANQAILVADRLREVRGWRFEAQQNPLFGEDDDVARYNVVWYDNTTAKIIGHANAPPSPPPPSPDRANLRSATPRGFARAVFDANSSKSAARGLDG